MLLVDLFIWCVLIRYSLVRDFHLSLSFLIKKNPLKCPILITVVRYWSEHVLTNVFYYLMPLYSFSHHMKLTNIWADVDNNYSREIWICSLGITLFADKAYILKREHLNYLQGLFHRHRIWWTDSVFGSTVINVKKWKALLN